MEKHCIDWPFNGACHQITTAHPMPHFSPGELEGALVFRVASKPSNTASQVKSVFLSLKSTAAKAAVH